MQIEEKIQLFKDRLADQTLFPLRPTPVNMDRVRNPPVTDKVWDRGTYFRYLLPIESISFEDLLTTSDPFLAFFHTVNQQIWQQVKSMPFTKDVEERIWHWGFEPFVQEKKEGLPVPSGNGLFWDPPEDWKHLWQAVETYYASLEYSRNPADVVTASPGALYQVIASARRSLLFYLREEATAAGLDADELLPVDTDVSFNAYHDYKPPSESWRPSGIPTDSLFDTPEEQARLQYINTIL